MKQLTGILVFLVVFVAVGIGMHAGLYGKPGVFVWSLAPDPGPGEGPFTRTTLALPAGAAAAASRRPGETGGQETAAQQASSGETGEESAEETPAPESSNPAGAEKADEAEEKGDADDGEIALFDGEELGEWEKTRFGGEGDVFVDEDRNLEFGFGAVMTGVHWGGEVPGTSNYEISMEAMKLDGYDFFCALTFPVKDSFATFVIGGWGGGVVGISCVDDLNASENETMNIEGFENDRWYRVRVRVTDERLEAWIDDDQKVDLALEGRKISLLPGDIELCKPLGIASYQTRAQYRDIVWRPLPKEE